jgi:hypothetical protein
MTAKVIAISKGTRKSGQPPEANWVDEFLVPALANLPTAGGTSDICTEALRVYARVERAAFAKRIEKARWSPDDPGFAAKLFDNPFIGGIALSTDELQRLYEVHEAQGTFVRLEEAGGHFLSSRQRALMCIGVLAWLQRMQWYAQDDEGYRKARVAAAKALREAHEAVAEVLSYEHHQQRHSLYRFDEMVALDKISGHMLRCAENLNPPRRMPGERFREPDACFISDCATAYCASGGTISTYTKKDGASWVDFLTVACPSSGALRQVDAFVTGGSGSVAVSG